MRLLGFPKEWENAVSVSIAFSADVLIRNENIDSEEHKLKSVPNNLACRVSSIPSKLND